MRHPTARRAIFTKQDNEGGKLSAITEPDNNELSVFVGTAGERGDGGNPTATPGAQNHRKFTVREVDRIIYSSVWIYTWVQTVRSIFMQQCIFFSIKGYAAKV